MNKSIEDILQELMACKGWNRKETAEKSGCSPATIGRILKGQAPDLDTLRRIASAFDVPASVFLGELPIENYTLDDAPVCVYPYLLDLPAIELNMHFLPSTGDIRVLVVPWDEEAIEHALRAIYRQKDSDRALVATCVDVGRDVLLFPALLFRTGHSEPPLSRETGTILGAIQDIASLRDYFRRQ